ncbi:cytospin-B-like isoform X1 [Oncorhynchus nerka]|uniref:cytospin-B-like isoform X1 n=1 Tax=Oncorhynchus nerka TaxID=8023 RepID=UPI0011304527|nr:cytospin-B-like isoform X1 [Oncorhynchus nerka]XP_029526993.1 cytospin-B-like isoform X1 [Oncorhynchus nerka]
MLKGGSAKVGLPKPGLQERAKQVSLTLSTTTSTTATGIKTSRSSNTLATDLRLSRLKRASSDDTLAKPALGAVATGSRMKKTVTTGAISDLADARPRSLSGVQSGSKKSGIPAPREIPPTMTRDRVSLRDQLRTSTNKKMVPSASTSSLATLAPKHQRGSTTTKPRIDAEGSERGFLECQIKELLAEAKAKEFEISKLRMELQRCRGKASSSSPHNTPSTLPEGAPEQGQGPSQQATDAQALVGELREKNGKFQRELAALREENQVLKEKLFSLESSPASPLSNNTTTTTSPSKPSINGLSLDNNTTPPAKSAIPSPLKTSVSSSSDITKGSPSPDSSEFEKIPSRSDSVSSSDGGCGGVGKGQGRNPSVERLTEQIQKMEESQHSTAEELQATLQELADQQQVVQELTAENERLAQEKGLLQTSLQQQRERVELLAQKNEALAGRLQEATQAQSGDEDRAAELEQRYTDLVQSSRFEREKLVDIQQQLTGSLRALEQEHQEAQGQVRSLREERDGLQCRVEREEEAGGEMTRAAEEHKAAADALRVKNGQLKAQVDIERQKVGELKAMQSAGDSTELQRLLKVAHAERDRLEGEVTGLRQELLQAQTYTEHAQGLLSKVEAECQQVAERAGSREEELSGRVSALENGGRQADGQIKDLKETIFELEDQVEQQRAVHLHTNQTILDLENQLKKLEEQKAEVERQLKILSKQMKDETEEWRRFQADLQTAVVVANDIKVEAQQEIRSLRRRLQEEQGRSAKLSSDLEQLQGVRLLRGDSESLSESDGSPHWCGISMTQTTQTPPTSLSINTNSNAASSPSEPGATVKSLIKSFDTAVQNGPGPGHTVQIHSSPRSLLSGIPVRTAPAAAVSPIQRHLSIKPLSKTLEKRINHGDFSHPDKYGGSGDELKPSSLMRKSPSLESVIKSPATLSSCSHYMSYNRNNSKLSVERKDPLAALAREYGGSKRNALLKWCQMKTEGYPNIDVTNFSSSWSDGLAFCALLHTYLPAHIPYQELISQDKGRNLSLAFQAAESIGIKPSLDIDELMHTDRPDWQSVMQYVSQIYKYFET